MGQGRRELDNREALLRGTYEQGVVLERSLEPRRGRITELQLQGQAARMAVEQFAEQLDAREVDRGQLKQMLDDLPDEWRGTGLLQSEVQRISRRIEGRGPVNLAALVELNPARERKERSEERRVGKECVCTYRSR